MPHSNRSDLSSLLSGFLQNKNQKRKLYNYADNLLFKLYKKDIARNVCPSDIISSITLKLLTGKITWDPDKCTLYRFYSSRVRSEVANLFKKEIKFITVPWEVSEKINDNGDKIDEDVDQPPQLLVYPSGWNGKEDEIDRTEVEKAAYEIFKDSVEEYCVLDEIYNGLKTNQIASKLGITVDDVHNIKKRIIRGLRKWAFDNKKIKFVNPLVPLINKKKSLINPPDDNSEPRSIL